MRTNCINSTDFQGRLFIQNKLSRVADFNLKQAKKSIEEILAKKDYNLYVKQDYSYNKVHFSGPAVLTNSISSVDTTVSIPVLSTVTKYIDAAKKASDKYEKALRDKEQADFERSRRHQKFRDLKGISETVLFIPLFAISEILRDINPKWSKNFEKNVIDRII